MKRKSKPVPVSGEPPVIEVKKITDLVQDAHNANLGTERGGGMLDGSLEGVGLVGAWSLMQPDG